MNEKLEIINDICMNYSAGNRVLDSRKCLTYIDEFEQKLNGTQKVISLVSFTALMDHYINEIEKNWLTEIRIKYNFEKGSPIHFTKLRKIAQNVKYNKDGIENTSAGWNDDYVISRANSLIDYERREFKNNVKGKSRKEFVEEYKVWILFRKESDNGIGSLDFDQLKNFYEDILLIIKNSNFKILCTSVIHYTKALHRIRFNSEQIRSPHVIAFSEHLDLLCFYLKHGFRTDEEIKNNGELYSGSFSTKLRWDGDDGFDQRHDYRLLFNKVISLGTTHYQSETVRKCIDEIRFVNKHEIGYYDDLEKQSLVSHIGCDIADFIAYFVGKYSIKDEIIKKELIQGITEDEAEQIFLDSVTFRIGDRVFSPYEEVLKEKIIITNEYRSVQVIKECHYNIL